MYRTDMHTRCAHTVTRPNVYDCTSVANIYMRDTLGTNVRALARGEFQRRAHIETRSWSNALRVQLCIYARGARLIAGVRVSASTLRRAIGHAYVRARARDV